MPEPGRIVGATLNDVREETLGDRVLLTHAPTGTQAEGPSRAEAMQALLMKAVSGGHISIVSRAMTADDAPCHQPLTSEQAEGYRTQITPAFSPGEIRSLLRECVTVVKPGETLVIRVADFTPAQVREYNDALNWPDADGKPWLPFRCLVVMGDELGVASAGEP